MKTTKLINFTAVAMIILSLCMPLANDAHKPVHCCCHLWHQLDHHTEPREPFFPLVFSETSAATGFFEYKQVNGGETLSLLQYWCPSADLLLIIENLTGCVTGFDLVAAPFPVILTLLLCKHIYVITKLLTYQPTVQGVTLEFLRIRVAPVCHISRTDIDDAAMFTKPLLT